MVQKKKSIEKKVVKKRIKSKATVILELLEQMKDPFVSHKELVDGLSLKYGITKQQSRAYLKQALKKQTIKIEENIERVREMHKEYMMNRMKDCVSKAKQFNDSRWEAKAIEWHTKLLALYPNDLKIVNIDPNDKPTSVEFNFTKFKNKEENNE